MEFKVKLEPEEFVREMQETMRKVFEYLALAFKGSIQIQKFLHDRKIRGTNLLDRVYLKKR